MVEIEHELLQIALAHLAVADAHACFGNQRANLRGAAFNRSRHCYARNRSDRRAGSRASRLRAPAARSIR